MIRDPSGSTIISYHPSGAGFTSAKDLCSRVHIGVRNPQWSTLLNEGRDPTVVLLIFLWHVMYSWDEALQRLYLHIDTLVSALSLEVGEAYFDSIIPLPSGDRRLKEDRKEKHEELYDIRAYLWNYISTLQGFSTSVTFVRNSPSPLVEPDVYNVYVGEECARLSSEITRLKDSINTSIKRVENLMYLASIDSFILSY